MMTMKVSEKIIKKAACDKAAIKAFVANKTFIFKDVAGKTITCEPGEIILQDHAGGWTISAEDFARIYVLLDGQDIDLAKVARGHSTKAEGTAIISRKAMARIQAEGEKEAAKTADLAAKAKLKKLLAETNKLQVGGKMATYLSEEEYRTKCEKTRIEKGLKPIPARTTETKSAPHCDIGTGTQRSARAQAEKDWAIACERAKKNAGRLVRNCREKNRRKDGAIEVASFVPAIPATLTSAGAIKHLNHMVEEVILKNDKEVSKFNAQELVKALAKRQNTSSISELVEQAKNYWPVVENDKPDKNGFYKTEAIKILQVVLAIARGQKVPEEVLKAVQDSRKPISYFGYKTKGSEIAYSVLGAGESEENWKRFKKTLETKPALEMALATCLAAKVDEIHFNTLEEASETVAKLTLKKVNKGHLKKTTGAIRLSLKPIKEIGPDKRNIVAFCLSEALRGKGKKLNKEEISLLEIARDEIARLQAGQPRKKVRFINMDLTKAKVYPWKSSTDTVSRATFWTQQLDKELPSGKTLRETLADLQLQEALLFDQLPDLQAKVEIDRAKQDQYEEDVFYTVDGHAVDLEHIERYDKGTGEMTLSDKDYDWGVISGEEMAIRAIWDTICLVATNARHCDHTLAIIIQDWISHGGTANDIPEIWVLPVALNGQKGIQTATRLIECDQFAALAKGKPGHLSEMEYDLIVKSISADKIRQGWTEEEVATLTKWFGLEGGKAFRRIPLKSTIECWNQVTDLNLGIIDPCKWVYFADNTFSSLKALRSAVLSCAEALDGTANKSIWCQRVVEAIRNINMTELQMAVEGKAFIWKTEDGKELDSLSLALNSKKSVISTDLLRDILFAEGSISLERQRFINRAVLQGESAESAADAFDYVGYIGGSAIEDEVYNKAFSHKAGSQKRFADEATWEDIETETGSLMAYLDGDKTSEETGEADSEEEVPFKFDMAQATQSNLEWLRASMPEVKGEVLNFLDDTAWIIKGYINDLDTLKKEIKDLRSKGAWKYEAKKTYSVLANQLLMAPIPKSISEVCPQMMDVPYAEGLVTMFCNNAAKKWTLESLTSKALVDRKDEESIDAALKKAAERNSTASNESIEEEPEEGFDFDADVVDFE